MLSELRVAYDAVIDVLTRTRSLYRALCALIVLFGAIAARPAPADAPFIAANSSAMNSMMAAMTIVPSGDADVDFVAMMTPHHKGAIAMAQAEIRYGRNELLHRLAQEIIVTQQQEITAMKVALGSRPTRARGVSP